MIHMSDCAVYNEPALPKGECDCKGPYYAAYRKAEHRKMQHLLDKGVITRQIFDTYVEEAHNNVTVYPDHVTVLFISPDQTQLTLASTKIPEMEDHKCLLHVK